MAKQDKGKGEISSAKGGGLQQQRRRAMSPFEEMDRMFEGFFPRGFMRPMRMEWPEWSTSQAPFEGRTPKVDVVERDEEIMVRAELPGVEKDHMDVSVTDDTVTIKATTQQESEEDKGDYHRREISQGSFTRTVALPAPVQSDQAKASFKNGILELTLPKAVPAKRHNIKVE